MRSQDFFEALKDLETEKKISMEQFTSALEDALTSAYKKTYGEAKLARVELNPSKNSIVIYSGKTVVENVEDSDKEISLDEARGIKLSYKVGDVVWQEETTKGFGRIAAQTASQVVKQKIRELERSMALSEISEKEDELITGIVERIDGGTIYVKLPSTATSHIEGVLLDRDQIPNEKFSVGDHIKVYVKKIKDTFAGTQIQVTRSNIGFVRKLFELEVPEIASGDVIIKNIVRDAGNRTKVAVYSENPNIDPVGACVGNHGIRINTIVSELGGEKVDLVLYSDDPLEYIARALSPAKVVSVETNDSLKQSLVIVPDDKLSLAIGKQGQNVRLAVKLTGYKIEVKPESAIKTQQQKLETEQNVISDMANDESFDNFGELSELDEQDVNLSDLEEIPTDEE